MSDQPTNSNMSRRNFLRNATLTAVAATAAGTGAAAVLSKDGETVISAETIPPISAPSSPAVITAVNNGDDVFARLASAEAENVRLQAELDAALRQIESLSSANQNASTNTQDLALQLQDANSQVGILAGLVSLYEQLDGVDVGDWLQDGISAVGDGLTDLLGLTPDLNDSVADSERMLGEIETHLPLLENGRAWLDGQIDRLSGRYISLEYILQEVVESVGDMLEMIENWLNNIRKWLPFGVGEKAAQVVGAFSDLVNETPYTIAGLDTNIAQPLDTWLEKEEGDQPRLQTSFIRPMREGLLAKTADAVGRTEQLDQTYRERVAQPAETAIAARQTLREQIAAYREQHQL